MAVLPNPLNIGADDVVLSPPPNAPPPPPKALLNVGAVEAGAAPNPLNPLPMPPPTPNPAEDVVCVRFPNCGADVEAVFVPKPPDDPNADGAADGC